MSPEDAAADLSVAEHNAARSLSPVVWRQKYVAGRGPMVHARGPWWPAELRRLARRWRKLADRAEVCADAIERHR